MSERDLCLIPLCTAVQAIDCLLDSKWAKDTDKNPALFTSRESVIDFLDTMLRHKFFHRARKIIVTSEPKKKKKTDDAVESSAAEDKDKVRERKKAKKAKAGEDGDKPVGEQATASDAGTDVKPEKKEKREKEGKKKVKLDMHLEQIVVDGNEVSRETRNLSVEPPSI